MLRVAPLLLIPLCVGLVSGAAMADDPAPAPTPSSNAPFTPVTPPLTTPGPLPTAGPQLFPLPVVPPPAATPYRFGFSSLRLDPRSMQGKPGEEPMIGEPIGLAPGFLQINLPEHVTPLAVGAEIGIFAGKLLLIKSLCGLGRCRVHTGPGDLSSSWLEELHKHPLISK